MKGALKVLLILVMTSISGQAKVYNSRTFTLKNGLQVVVIENHRAPVVTQMVWYKVGSGDDPIGKSGVAHFLEHMMFKGPKNSASAKITREVEALGGSLNAATSYDYTYYYQTVAARYLEDVMRLESERMKQLTILENEAQNELQVILEERRMRTDNQPFGRFIEFFHSQYFRTYPKRLPPIGWAHEIKALTAADARDFHRKWYSPSNAILFLAGDITFKKAKRLAEKYYGSLKRRPIPKRARLTEPPQPQAKVRLDLEMPDVRVPYFIKAFPAPTIFDKDISALYTSDVLTNLLAAVPTGFLYRDLVENKKVSTFITVYYPYQTLGPSYLLIACQPTPGISMKELEKSLEESLISFRTTYLNDTALKKAKTRLLATLIYDQDSVLSGREIPEGLALGLSLKQMEQWDDKISEVTLDQVKALFDFIILKKYHVTGTIVPLAPLKQQNQTVSTFDSTERGSSLVKEATKGEASDHQSVVTQTKSLPLQPEKK